MKPESAEANKRDILCFSILWVDRGGETVGIEVTDSAGLAFQYPLGGSWG